MWVSQGGLPIGLTIGGYHHGATEKAGNRHRARRREVVALGVRRDARRRGAAERARRQQGKRARFPFRQIPRRAGCRRPAAHEASKLFGGDAKTDERDATVIAKTAFGIPDALLPVAHPDPAIAAARSITAQRDFLICENTRNKNRLRSILLESCPEFEALVDLSDAAELRLMAAPGSPWSMADASGRKTAALARGANCDKVSELIESVGSSTKPDAAAIAAEGWAVRLLARRIAENAAEIEADDDAIAALLERDETCRCLLTIPGVGPKTASELAISINIDDFPSHDRLASYCGLAPRNRQSGTSISSVSASRQGNKRLKNLLIFSCNCLARTNGRWGEYYARCRARDMPHGKALKAVARKRLKVIYTVMRDKVPYVA